MGIIEGAEKSAPFKDSENTFAEKSAKGSIAQSKSFTEISVKGSNAQIHDAEKSAASNDENTFGGKTPKGSIAQIHRLTPYLKWGLTKGVITMEAMNKENIKQNEYYVGELISDIRFNYEVSQGYQEIMRRYEDDSPERFKKFRKIQRDAMLKLAPLIQKRNEIYISKEELGEALGIRDPGNLTRFFKQLPEHLVQYTSSHMDKAGVERGWVYVEINPLYCWRSSLTHSRFDAVASWYRFLDLSETSKVDICLVPYYRTVHPNPKLLDAIGK